MNSRRRLWQRCRWPAQAVLSASLLATLLAPLGGCGSAVSFRMLSPKVFGMEQAGPRLYVEAAMDAEQRRALAAQIAIGRDQVERFYGMVTTTPYFVACMTPECTARFGSYGERAAAFGESAVRLSYNGLAAALVAHEWSHAELYGRVGGWWVQRRIPRWFDEGLAVVVADEPRHSEANWREIQRRKLPTPALSELVSRSDWTRALGKYAETQADDPDNLRVVYGSAGHELRQWLSCTGPAGAVTLLAAVRAGEAFDAAYARIGRACAR